MGKTKRILSFFIALIMVLALVPFNAIVYAVDVETGDEAQTQAPSNEKANEDLPSASVSRLPTETIKEFTVFDKFAGDANDFAEILNPQVLMQFVAKDTAESAANSAYAKYIADFYISVDGLSQATYGKGCYLVGHYEGYGWYAVPLDGIKVENVKYPVMSSIAAKLTYEQICTSVKDFKCGIYFAPEFIEANPNMKVSLELGLSETFEQAENAEFTRIGDAYTYTAKDLALPSAIVNKIPPVSVNKYTVYNKFGGNVKVEGTLNPQVLMQFIAQDTEESAKYNAYANYLADFYIKLDGIAQETAGTGCYLIGYYEGYDWYVVPLDGITVNKGTYPVMSSIAAKLKYTEICASVKDFKCGIYFSDAFIASNPNVSVSLELGLSETFEQAENAEYIKIGDTYTYTVEDLTSDAPVFIPDKLTGTVVDEIKNNTSLDEYTPVNVPEGAELVIELVSVDGKIVYDVTPMANGEKVEELAKAITFRLPVPASIKATQVKVYHEKTLMGTYNVMGSDNAKYVEISSADFSKFAIEPVEVSLPDYVVLPENVTVDSFGNNTVTDGTNYWATLQAAVQAIADAKTTGAILYCKPGADVGSLQHAPVINTLTIYGNGASVTGGSERDFDIGNTDPSGGKDITSDITLTVKYLNGCGAWGTKATSHTVNLVFENCQNMGKVFLNGTTGTLNITMTDCTFEGVLAEAIYSNADGKIELTGVDFSNLNKAINLNHKANGTQTVVLTDCSFTNCGNNVSADQIPVRVLSSVAGGQTVLTVSGCSFSGTPAGGADILIDYAVGTTTATISETAANVAVEYENNNATTTTTTDDGSADFTNVAKVYVAQIGDVKYETLEDALNAANNGDTIEVIVAGEYALKNKNYSEGRYWLPANLTIKGVDGVVITNAPAFSANSITIENIDFINKSGSAVTFYTSGDSKFVGCDLIAPSGTYYSTASGKITFEDCVIKGTSTYGLNINEGYADIVVKNSTLAGWNSFGQTSSILMDKCVFLNEGPYAQLRFYNDAVITNTKFDAGYNVDAGAPIKLTLTGCSMSDSSDLVGILNAKMIESSKDVIVDGVSLKMVPVASIGDVKYATLYDAIKAAKAGDKIVLLADADLEFTDNPMYNYIYASEIDLGGFTLTIKEGDIRPGNDMIIKNGNIVLEKKNYGGTAVIVLYGSVTLTLDGVNLDAKGASGTYILGLEGKNAYLNITNGTEIIVENENIVNLIAVVSHNGTGKVTISDSKVSVSNINGRAFLGGSYVVENSDIDATGVKAGFYIKANQSLEIKGTSTVDISNLANGYTDGIYLANAEVVYTKADTASVNSTVTQFKTYVAQIGDNKYETLEDALNAAQAGDEVILLADVAEDVTVPAGVIFNGNGKQVGVITAAGEITFKGHTKTTNFGVQYTNTTINIIEGACLELTGTGRMVIGHGCTFNITGTITDAKTADKANITPSLIAAGASFTGAGVNFNVTNAYVKFTAYCSSKNSSANGTFNFDVENSIWEQTGSFVFSEPTSGKDPTFNLTLKNSVLDSTSHLVFAVAKGEIVFDNSNVNVGASRQIENRSTLTIKNGSVVNGAVATSSNAKNPGTIIVENATYAVTGEFTGSDVGTGTLVIKKGANITIGKITKANIVIDATDMVAGEIANFTANLSAFAGELSVINNDKLEAKIVDGKIVLSAKAVAQIGDTKYETLEDAIAAAKNGDEVVILVAGTYTVPSGKDITITGAVDSVVFDNIKKHAMGGASVTFNNVTFNYSMTEGHNGLQHSGDLVYNNCTFKGQVFLYGTSETFNNCTFNQTDVNNYNVWTYAADDVKFNGCKFYSAGRSLLIYSEGADLYANVVITDCDFISSNAVDGKAAIEMDSSLSAGIKVTIDAATTATGFGNGNVSGNSLWNNKKGNETAANNDITVVVNGVTVLAPVTYVAQIGDKKYTSLEDAIAAAQNGETVVLLADITLTEGVTVANGTTVVLDLNGKTINAGWDNEADEKHIYVFTNNGDLTITGNGVINTRGIFNYGKLTLNGGTINAIDHNGGYGVRNYAGATFTMNSGTIATTNEDGDKPGSGYDACPVRVDEGATFIMNAGTINNISNFTCAIDNYGTTTINGGTFTTIHTTIANSGTMTINGGTFTCNGLEGVTAHAVWAAKGTLTINGGTFNGKDNYNGFNVDASKGAVVYIKGGNFLSVHSGSLYGEGTIEVSGGTFFDAVPEKYCAEGYVPCDNGNGTYGVAKKVLEQYIAGTSVLLEDSFTIRFYIDATKITADNSYFAVITVDGVETVVAMNSEWTKYSSAYYYLDVALATKAMTDIAEIIIYEGTDSNVRDNQLSTAFQKSIQGYAMTELEKAKTSDALKTLLVDMLNLGAQAQVQFNYKTDNLANAQLTETQKSWGTKKTVDAFNSNYVNNATGNFRGTTASLEETINLNLYFVKALANSNTKFVVTYTDYLGVANKIEFTGDQIVDKAGYAVVRVPMVAADIRTVITCEVYVNGASVGTVTHSIEAYCANGGNEGIYQSIMKYGDSANKYFKEN